MTTERRNLRGILWILADAFVMSGLLLCGKLLGTHAMAPLVVICLANALAAVVGLALAMTGGRFSQIWPLRPTFHVERAAFGIASTGCLLMALKTLNLYEVGAFNLMIPLSTGVAAALVYRERVSGTLIISLVAAATGVALLLVGQNAGVGVAWPALQGAIFCIASVFFSVLNNLNQKRIGVQERLDAQRVCGPLFSALLSLPAAIWFWKPVDPVALGLIAVYGALLTGRMYTRFLAFRYADVSVLMPFDYTQLLWLALWSALWFDQSISMLAAVGMAFVVSGGCLLLWREVRHARIPSGG